MSEVKSKAVFNQILKDFRSELSNIKKLHAALLRRLDIGTKEETQEWIMDTYVDALQELDTKMQKIKKELVNNTSPNFSSAINAVTKTALDLSFEQSGSRRLHIKKNLTDYVQSLLKSAENEFMNMRATLWQSDWQGIDNVKPITYATTERKKYVSAIEELKKAKDCLDGKIEDVTLHLRPAINQALLERFCFKKIHPMSRFIADAKKLNFELPSYDFIYDIFDEGSDRLHAGKAPTPWEAQEMIRTVSNFIDALELMEVSDEQIEEFKKNSPTVS